MIRIIGIGSPLGDDAAGLVAARRLAAAPPRGCQVIAADRPGAGLIDLLEGAAAVILIDAVRSDAAPGAIHVLNLREIGALGERLVSSHGIGVASAIELAAKLERAPVRGRLIGIEAATGGRGLDEISPAVKDAIERAIALARKWAARLSKPARAGRHA
jgi:hydrogenase maturation protease